MEYFFFFCRRSTSWPSEHCARDALESRKWNGKRNIRLRIVERREKKGTAGECCADESLELCLARIFLARELRLMCLWRVCTRYELETQAKKKLLWKTLINDSRRISSTQEYRFHRALAATQVWEGARKTIYERLKMSSRYWPDSESSSGEFNKLVLHSSADEECDWNLLCSTTSSLSVLRCSEFPSHFHLTCLCFSPASTDGVETDGNFAARHFQVDAKADRSKSAARHRRHVSLAVVNAMTFRTMLIVLTFLNAREFSCFCFPLCVLARRGRKTSTYTFSHCFIENSSERVDFREHDIAQRSL